MPEQAWERLLEDNADQSLYSLDELFEVENRPWLVTTLFYHIVPTLLGRASYVQGMLHTVSGDSDIQVLLAATQTSRWVGEQPEV